MGYLFALGFISILGQVVLLRELSVAFYGVELIYTLSLGVWLISTAFGALIQRRTRPLPAFSGINFLFVLFSAGLPLDVAFVRSVRLLLTDFPGLYLPLHAQMAAMCACLLPIGLILGLLFQWTAKRYVAGGKSLARAYAVESMGGIAGGLCATLFLNFGFQNLVLALICALIAAGSSFLDFDGHAFGKLRGFSLIVFALLLFSLWKAPMLDRLMTSWTHPNLVETRDSPYSRITVTYLEGQVSVFENDALLFDTEGTRAEEFVHVAALQHPKPDSILVLGGGIEGILHEALMHRPRTIDYVELNPALLRLVPTHLPLETQQSLRAASVRITEADPRQFLARARTYDLILVGMPDPSSGQTNRFYTREFFQQCGAKLNPDGIVAFSLRSSENIWTPQLARRMISIYKAARSAFPEVLFLPGSTNVVIGSRSPLPRDPSILAARLETRGLKPRIVSAPYLRYLYTNDRYAEVQKTLESGTAPVNTDVRPICYQYTTMIWLSKFLPSAKFWDFSLPDIRSSRGVAWLAALCIPFLLLSRASWRIRRALLTGVAGFLGMTLETILLLHFQTKTGVLYQDIGILLTGFMAGLALGAFAVERLHNRPAKLLGASLLGGFAALSAGAGLGINSGLGAGLPSILVLLLLAGFLVAAVFAYAGLHRPDDQVKAISPLYSADLIGGCVGSLVASLFLAPVAGLALTSLLMIPVVILSALLL